MMGVQAVSALGPFIVLPLIARGSGSADWSSFVLGQSFGLMMASIASYGWSVVGITRVARAPRPGRPGIFAESIITRALTITCVGTLGFAVLLLGVRPASPLVAASVCFGFLIYTGLAMNWYYVAIGSPWKNLFYGTAPLLLAGGLTIVVVHLGGSAVFYGPTLVVLGLAAMSLAIAIDVKPSASDWKNAASPSVIAWYFKSEFAVFLTQSLTAVYTALPMAFAGANLPIDGAARYATADRINTLSTTGVGTVGKVLQGWRSEAVGGRRAHFAMSLTVSLGISGGCFLILGGDWFTSILFGSAVSVPGELSVFVGLFAILVSIRYSLVRYYLVPSGEYSATTFASLASLVVLGAGLVLFRESLDLVLIGEVLCIAEGVGVVILAAFAVLGSRRAGR